jgi:hypothetical protein
MNLTQQSDRERNNTLIMTTWAFEVELEMRFSFLFLIGVTTAEKYFSDGCQRLLKTDRPCV